MRYAALLVVALAACSSPLTKPDAPDVPPDSAGSGSDAAVAMETSPTDSHLELMVVGLCLVIALGPTFGTTRRRMT